MTQIRHCRRLTPGLGQVRRDPCSINNFVLNVKSVPVNRIQPNVTSGGLDSQQCSRASLLYRRRYVWRHYQTTTFTNKVDVANFGFKKGNHTKLSSPLKNNTSYIRNNSSLSSPAKEDKVNSNKITTLSASEKSRIRRILLNHYDKNKKILTESEREKSVKEKIDLLKQYVLSSVSINSNKKNKIVVVGKRETETIQQGLWNVLNELLLERKNCNLKDANNLIRFVMKQNPSLVDAKCLHVVLSNLASSPRACQDLMKYSIHQIDTRQKEQTLTVDAACIDVVINAFPTNISNAEYWFSKCLSIYNNNIQLSTVQALMKVYCRNGQMSRAYDLLSSVQERNKQPNNSNIDTIQHDHSYVILMDGYASQSPSKSNHESNNNIRIMTDLFWKLSPEYLQKVNNASVVYSLFLKAMIANQQFTLVQELLFASPQHSMRQVIDLSMSSNEYNYDNNKKSEMLDTPIQPNIAWLNLFLDAHVKLNKSLSQSKQSQVPLSPEKMEELWKVWCNERYYPKIIPSNTTTYGILIQAWSNSIQEQSKSFRRGKKSISDKGIKQNKERKEKNLRAAQQAHALLKQMMPNKNSIENVGDIVAPNTICFTSVIQAWSKCGEPQSAEKLLQKMEYYHNHHHLWEVQPNTMTYNTVIHAWATHPHPQSIYKAEAILQQMTTYDNITPNIFTYASIIHAWSNSPLPHAPTHAQALFERMLSSQQQKNATQNNDEIVTDEIDIIYEQDHSDISGNHDNIITSCFANVISGWSRCGNIERVDELFQRTKKYLLKHQHEQQTFGNISVMYSIVMKAWMKHRSKEKISLQKRVDRVSKLFQELLQESDKFSNKMIQPDTVIFNTVLSAYSRLGKAREAMNLLTNVMPQYNVSPDVTTFNSVIYAWSKSKDQNASKHAKDLLTLMLSFRDENLKPNLFTFSNVFHTLAQEQQLKMKANKKFLKQSQHQEINDHDNSSLLECVTSLLQIMIHDLRIEPDTIIFNTILTIISRSNDEQKVNKALAILSHMEQSTSKPDVQSYALVISACAFTSGKDKNNAFQKAEEVFQKAKLYQQINQYTYDAFLKALCFLNTPNIQNKNDINLLEETFMQCCRDGYVDDAILKFVRPRLLQAKKINLNDPIPAEWRRNVKSFRKK